MAAKKKTKAEKARTAAASPSSTAAPQAGDETAVGRSTENKVDAQGEAVAGLMAIEEAAVAEAPVPARPQIVGWAPTEDHIAAGRAARKMVPRTSHAGWAPPHDRPDLLKEYKLSGLPIKRGAVDVSPGIEAVATLIHYEADEATGKVRTPPRFYVLDRPQGARRDDYRGCPNTIREISGYKWATNSDGSARAEEKPLKQDDHCPDAARVAIYNEVGKKTIGPIDKPIGA
jgi:hypothetical protein